MALVSPREYWDYAISSPRCVTTPEDGEQYTPSLEAICDHLGCSFVKGMVAEVRSDGVTLDNGEVLEARAVVVAIGGSYLGNAIWKARPDEVTAAQRLDGFRAKAKEIGAAQHVVVGGAGLVGVEVAGEIKSRWPDKSVTLVGRVGGAERLRQKTERALDELGVTVVPDRTIGEPSEGVVQLKSGADPLPCDLLLSCAGFSYDPACLRAHFSSAITDRGMVMADSQLRVQGAENVYALGDIVATPDGAFNPAAGIMKAGKQAEVVAANVASVLKGQRAKKSYVWPSTAAAAAKPALTAFGPSNAVAFLGMPGCASFAEDKVARKAKAADFFMAHAGKMYGKGKTW